MRVTLKEFREILKQEIGHVVKKEGTGAVLTENIGFPTPRNSGLLPENFAQFRQCFGHAFARMNLQQLAGKVGNINESNAVINGLDKMWATVDKEMSGNLGMPAPTFKEGREFWAYFAPEFTDELTHMIENSLVGAKLAKGNSRTIAENVLDILKSGS